MEQVRIPVGDLTFDALAAGPADGQGVILLHGFPETNIMWKPVMEALAADGYRCIAPNQRGYSPEARPEEVAAYTTGALASDVAGSLDHFGWEQAHVIGHDWGAAVAWRVAAQYPERTRTLNVLSVGHPDALTKLILENKGDQRERSAYMRFFAEPDSHQKLLADDAKLLRRVYQGWGDNHELDTYLEFFRQPGALAAALNWYRAMGRSTGGQKIDRPVLFMWSTNDPALGRQSAEATADWVSGPYRFVELEGVSHWIVQEAPDRVVAEIRRHLAEFSSPS